MLKIRIFSCCYVDDMGCIVNEFEELWINAEELSRYEYLEPEIVERG